jgi:hypothetical protein
VADRQPADTLPSEAQGRHRASLRSLGDTLDHLASSTMGFQDWPPREQLAVFYQAARLHASGAPICWRMANALLEATHPDGLVILATGEYEPNEFRHGETDGPVGIAVLARTLIKLGRDVVIVCDPHLQEVHRAVVDQFAGTRLNYALFAGGTGFDYEARAAWILDAHNPAALIACEKLGRNSAGEYHGAFGSNCSAHENRVDYLFDLAYEQGRLTLSFGDQGNEIGFGTIRSTAMEVAPWGRICRCPCESGIIAVTQTTFLHPAAVSNWGAIAVGNMLAAMTDRQDLVHTPGRQRWLQEVLLECQVIDGALGIVARSVDSIDGDVDLALVQLMEAATLRSMTTKGAYFRAEGATREG